MNQLPKDPPCSLWSVWIGREVEGFAGVAEMTLFIRRLPPAIATDRAALAVLLTRSKATRLWFCKEFTDWALVDQLTKGFIPGNVCIEVEPRSFGCLPRRFRDQFRIYVKVALPLKPGDHVCVGAAFRDESFELGSGRTVSPSDYKKDIQIL